MPKTANTAGAQRGEESIKTGRVREDFMKKGEFEFVLMSGRAWRLEKTGNKT